VRSNIHVYVFVLIYECAGGEAIDVFMYLPQKNCHRGLTFFISHLVKVHDLLRLYRSARSTLATLN
jgi:hypothetical protein